MKEVEINDLPPCLIYIDKGGYWHHKGVEMIRRDFIRIFYENMKMDAQGRYVIHWSGKQCIVDVEDTAFVVWKVVYQEGTDGSNARVVLFLSDESREDLSPDTLHVGMDNVLYCKVKGNTFPARFNRAAYYTLANHIEEEGSAFYLPLNGKRYKIPGIT